MLEGTYTAPNGWHLEWRTFCADDCQMYPRPIVCRDCQHEAGDLTLYDATGQRQSVLSGVIVQATIDRAVEKLKQQAERELQPVLFEMGAA